MDCAAKGNERRYLFFRSLLHSLDRSTNIRHGDGNITRIFWNGLGRSMNSVAIYAKGGGRQLSHPIGRRQVSIGLVQKAGPEPIDRSLVVIAIVAEQLKLDRRLQRQGGQVVVPIRQAFGSHGPSKLHPNQTTRRSL